MTRFISNSCERDQTAADKCDERPILFIPGNSDFRIAQS